MRTHFLRILALVATAATVLLSCDKEKTNKIISVGITAEESFAEDNTAEVIVTLSDAVTRNVVVTLATSSSALPGTTALPGSKVDYPANVTIAAGSTSATFTATLDPSSLTPDTYSIGIQILSATGASVSKDAGVAFIKATVSSYSGGGGGSTSGEGSYTGWSVTYKGFIPFTYTDGYGQTVTEDSEVFDIKGTGTNYYYYALVEGGFYADYIQNATQASVAEIVAGWIQEDIEYYSAYDDNVTAADMIEQEEQLVGYDEFKNGNYEFFIFGTDASGNYNGKYAWCFFTKTGSSVTDDDDEGGDEDFPDDISSASLQSNWTLTFTETYFDSENGWVDKLKVSAPGATYIDLSWLTDEDLAEYDDDLEVLNDVQFFDYFDYEDYASTPTDYFYVHNEDALYEHEAGTWTVFLIDFNADWTLTGKYGKCTVTIPSDENADAPRSASVQKPLWQKYNKNFPAKKKASAPVPSPIRSKR